MTKQAFTTQPKVSWPYRRCMAPFHRYMGKENVHGWVWCESFCVGEKKKVIAHGQRFSSSQMISFVWERYSLLVLSMLPTWCWGWRGSLLAVRIRSCLCLILCSSWTVMLTCSPLWPRSSPTRVLLMRSMGSLMVGINLFLTPVLVWYYCISVITCMRLCGSWLSYFPCF